MARILQSRAFPYAAATLGIGAVTSVCALLRSYLNEMTVALAMLLVVLFVAALWEYGPALIASVAGMLCLNYFFLPPVYTLTIADPKNWVALASFPDRRYNRRPSIRTGKTESGRSGGGETGSPTGERLQPEPYRSQPRPTGHHRPKWQDHRCESRGGDDHRAFAERAPRYRLFALFRRN